MKKLISKIEFKVAEKDYVNNGGANSVTQLMLQNTISHICDKNEEGILINKCISKEDAIDLASQSNGILINTNGTIDVSSFNRETLNEGLFAISKDAIENLPSHINSIKIYKKNIDFVIVEYGRDYCNSDNPGGDGIKMKIPIE